MWRRVDPSRLLAAGDACRARRGFGPVASLLMANLRSRIEELWRRRTEIDADDEDVITLIREAIDLLDGGEARVAEVVDDEVVVHEWLKEAILLLFHQARMVTQEL